FVAGRLPVGQRRSDFVPERARCPLRQGGTAFVRLADPDAGMNLLLSGGYSEIEPRRKPLDAAPPRPLSDPEPITVKDYWWDPATRKYSDRSSRVPGSTAALTAYMIALMTNDLVNDGSVVFGEIGCKTIHKNLAD